jgi:membrane associated rhomboid family serine protease
VPPVTQSLIIANVAIFLLEFARIVPPLPQWFALWPDSRFQLWQLVTYGFLHDQTNFTHIIFNMFGLYMFGSEIERLFGARFYLLYYLVSVVVAALTHLLVTSLMGAPAPMVGASGGVYGLLLAFGWYFPHRRVVLLFPPIPMPARIFVIVFGVLELVFGVTGTAAGVAHFAHLGGMLGGWLMIEARRRRLWK